MAKALATVKKPVMVKKTVKATTKKNATRGRDWAKMTKAQRKVMIRKADLDPVMAKNASIEYYKTLPATMASVTGDSEKSGAASFAVRDVKKSTPLLKKLLPRDADGRVKRFGRVLDAGAGIGRVTEDLLRHHSKQVDLLEPWKPGLEKAKERLGGILKTSKNKGGCRFTYLNRALQDFQPKATERSYDLVWIQGVMLYMSDQEMITFLEKADKGLSPTGKIVVKEMVTDSSRREKSYLDDADDNRLTVSSTKGPISVVRSDTRHRAIFKKARMEICEELSQPGGSKAGDDNDWMIYALRPKK